MSIWWEIDIKTGIVDHDSISWINDNFEVTEDTVFDLSQDLLQINFKNQKIILDVGWYPDLDANGAFRTELIKDNDWENPIISVESKDIGSLKHDISRVISDRMYE